MALGPILDPILPEAQNFETYQVPLIDGGFFGMEMEEALIPAVVQIEYGL